MKITFLGTGTSQGVPVIACTCEVCRSADERDKRLRASIMVEINGKTIVIDTGPDFRQQMLRENVANVDAILFTHEHKDHTAGLDDVRAYNYLKQMPMDVYAEERVQHSLMHEYAYVFAEKKYPGVPQINMHTINEMPFNIDGIHIIPIRTLHLRLPVLGFRIGDFTYITDTNYISENEKKKLFGTKYLVVTGLRKQKHISHFNLSEAVDLINEIKPEKGYVTHISHQLGLHAEVEKELPNNICLSYDGQTIDIED